MLRTLFARECSGSRSRRVVRLFLDSVLRDRGFPKQVSACWLAAGVQALRERVFYAWRFREVP